MCYNKSKGQNTYKRVRYRSIHLYEGADKGDESMAKEHIQKDIVIIGAGMAGPHSTQGA